MSECDELNYLVVVLQSVPMKTLTAILNIGFGYSELDQLVTGQKYT